MYEKGDGVSQNKAMAAELYRKAAEQGNVRAQFRLGLMYSTGEGVPEDQVKAVEWSLKAAGQDYGPAQVSIGDHFYFGKGVPKNYGMAEKWYRRAAEKGIDLAQFKLGSLYLKGEGVPENQPEAAAWYKSAAEQGLPEAQFRLGAMYYLGLGIPENKVLAEEWYRKAASQGNADAKHQLKISFNYGKGISNRENILSESFDERKNIPNKSTISANDPKQGDIFTEPSIDMEFVYVPAGCFQMGSPVGEDDREHQEGPVHEACVDGFYIGKYEVTNGQYRRFRPSHDSKAINGQSLNGENQPVVHVSWEDSIAYSKWLSNKSGKTFRLPTEAEWEYAARGGTTTGRFWGENADDACSYANIHDLASKRVNKFPHEPHKCDDGYAATSPVGKFKANNFGLYDMLGNAWEWCNDWYGKNYYSSSPKLNPRGPDSTGYRVDRGGGWAAGTGGARSAFRGGNLPNFRDSGLGFRLVMQTVIQKNNVVPTSREASPLDPPDQDTVSSGYNVADKKDKRNSQESTNTKPLVDLPNNKTAVWGSSPKEVLTMNPGGTRTLDNCLAYVSEERYITKFCFSGNMLNQVSFGISETSSLKYAIQAHLFDELKTFFTKSFGEPQEETRLASGNDYHTFFTWRTTNTEAVSQIKRDGNMVQIKYFIVRPLLTN